jgi:hypothetical protein
MQGVRPIEATKEALFKGSYTEFLPEPKGHEEVICLFSGIGALKEGALGSLEDGTVHGMYEVPALLLLLLYLSCPYNSFSASIAN